MARKEYYKNKFATVSNCPKKIWNRLNDLMGKTACHVPSALTLSNVEYSGAALADKFIEHFLSTGESSHKQDRRHEIDRYIASPVVSSIFLKSCSEHEVFTFLSNLDKFTAAEALQMKLRSNQARCPGAKCSGVFRSGDIGCPGQEVSYNIYKRELRRCHIIQPPWQ
uniref:Uncharacterized protein n=1 Tax=Rhipicephalus zambeziensis TaxID=60191 RepID=A0A224Z0K9_9ACAR